MYNYEYPHPAVTADSVVFTIRDQRLHVLLIQRGEEPAKGQWAFPGGFVGIDEALEAAAHRELAEETGVTGIGLQQFHAFGAPDRDPRERIITVAYMGLAADEDLQPVAGDDAAAVAWHAVSEVPALASDHSDILVMAMQCLQQRIETTDIAMSMMSDRFTIADLQGVYEAIMDEQLDADVFRDWVLGQGWIEQTGELLD
jgi:8-oxo-dGTP diphosphatase